MRNLYILAVLFAASICSLPAQSGFQKSFTSIDGCQANTVIETQDGGYALAGWYDVDGLFSAEFFLIVTDAAGDTLWMRTYGKKSDTTSFAQNGSGNEGYHLVQTPDGGFLFSGERHEIAGGTSDVYLVRIDPDGELLWSRMYGGQENEYGLSAAQANDGNFVIGGFTESHGAGIRDMLLFKVDDTGDTLWTRTYGGESIDAAMTMRPTSDGGYVLCGYTFSYGAGSSDVYVIRTDAVGSILWQKTFGGALNDIGHSIIETADGGFLIAGETESFNVGNRDVYLIKTDADGAMQWSRAYGGDDYEAGNTVTQTTDNGYVIAGYTRGYGAGAEDFLVLKTDASGALRWARTYGGDQDDNAKSIISTADNGFVLTGYSRSFGNGNLDVYLIKGDSIGMTGCGGIVEGLTSTDVLTIEGTPASEIGFGTIIKERTTVVGKANIALADPCDIISHTDNGNNVLPFRVYPNPASDHLILEWNQNGVKDNSLVTVYDMMGRMLWQETFLEGENIIEISALAIGTYIVNVRTDNTSMSRIFVRQ